MMGASFVAFLAKAKRYFTVYTSILLKSKTSFMGAHWYLFTLNKKIIIILMGTSGVNYQAKANC